MLAPLRASRTSSKSPWAGLRAVLYLRCSDPQQDTSVEEQRDVLKDYARRHHIRIVDEFVDDGISGDATEKRRGFLEMRRAVETGRFDLILCWDQDRFGRFNSIEGGHWIYPFYKAGVQLVTDREGLIDWKSTTGRLISSITTEANHEFLHKHSRNVLRGQIAAAKSGSWIGSPPYGYKLIGERKHKSLVLGDPIAVEVVKRIFDEYVNQLRSMSNIADRLNADKIPSPGGNLWRFDAVKWILQNVAYVGEFRFNRYSRSKYNGYHNGDIIAGAKTGRNDETDQIIISDHHDAIIDRATFRKAQVILARGKTGRSPHTPETNPYLLTGKLCCGHCGEPLWGMEARKYRYYECSKRKHRGQKLCPGTTVREDVVLSKLSGKLKRIFDEACQPEAKEMIRLARKAANGEPIHKGDLPKAFNYFKRLFGVESRPVADPARIRKQIDSQNAKIDRAQRNLGFCEHETEFEAVRSTIRDLKQRRDELQRQLREQRSTEDVNRDVLNVLWKLADVAQRKQPDLTLVAREIDRIQCFTSKEGRGTRTRHQLDKIRIRFVRGDQRDLNPHRPG